MVSLDITGIIALGVDFETILGKNHEIFQAYEMLFTSTNEKRTLFMLYNLAPQWVLSLLPFPVAEKMDEARKLLANVCRQIIQGRLKQLERREAESQPLDFLTNLVLSDFFDEDAAIAQIVVILGAG
jgi:cytochrome P450